MQTEATLGRVHEQVAALLANVPAGQHAYVLIDNSALDGVWLQSQPKPERAGFGPVVGALRAGFLRWCGLMGEVALPAHSAAVPLLVEWVPSPRANRWLRELLEEGLLQHALQWLVSPLRFEELSRRLERRLWIEFGKEQMVLRYFDNRIFSELSSVLQPEQHAQWLSVATRWQYLDRDGELASQTCEFAEEDLLASPIETTAAQRAVLRKLGLVDRVQTHLAALPSGSLMPEALPSERYRWMRERIVDAERLGIEGVADLSAFCCMALTEGQDFHQRAEFQPLLSSMRESKAQGI